MLAITGATGKLGGMIIEELLVKVKPDEIVALTRTSAKASHLAEKGIIVREGSYGDPESLVKAFTGVDTLLFISNTDIISRMMEHQNVVDAVQEADVKHVVYTSFLTAGSDDILGKTHAATEEIIKANGLTYTFLRNGFYMDGYVVEVEIAIEKGVYRSPSGSSGVSLVTRRDIARAAAVVLTSEGHNDRVYELTGPESVTPIVFARVAAAISGKDIFYEPITWEELEEDYRGRGYSDDRIDISMLLEKIVASNALARTSGDIQKLTGTSPTDLLTLSRQLIQMD